MGRSTQLSRGAPSSAVANDSDAGPEAAVYQREGGFGRPRSMRDFGAVELIENALGRIEALDPRISAFGKVIGDRALADARRIDDLRRAASRWALFLVPIGIQEIVDTRRPSVRLG